MSIVPDSASQRREIRSVCGHDIGPKGQGYGCDVDVAPLRASCDLGKAGGRQQMKRSRRRDLIRALQQIKADFRSLGPREVLGRSLERDDQRLILQRGHRSQRRRKPMFKVDQERGVEDGQSRLPLGLASRRSPGLFLLQRGLLVLGPAGLCFCPSVASVILPPLPDEPPVFFGRDHAVQVLACPHEVPRILLLA